MSCIGACFKNNTEIKSPNVDITIISIGRSPCATVVSNT